MKINRNLTFIGISLFALTIGTFAGALLGPLCIHSRLAKSQNSAISRHTEAHFGLVKFESVDRSTGDFEMHIGIRNPFE